MPLPSVHFLLARIPLRRWSRSPAHAPFDVTDAAARNAYYQGALGPDMGIFPGGEPILSELAHHFRPNDLTHTLIDGARTDVQRAFAWGWVTHMIADDALHPLIDAEAARTVAASGGDPTDPVLIAAEHARIELGLDILVRTHDPQLRALRLRPCFDSLSIRYLAESYRSTYGLPFNPKWLLRSHNVVAPLAAALGLLEHTHAHAATDRACSAFSRGLLHCIRRGLARRMTRQVAAFLHPVRPSGRLLNALVALRERFAYPQQPVTTTPSASQW
jgi:enoyl-CoA hydratase/carnithine racemase